MSGCACGYNIPANMARHKRTCKVIPWYEKCEQLQKMNAQLKIENTELVRKNARLEHQLSEMAHTGEEFL